MILCLDIGNTHFYGGIFIDGKLKFQFRKISMGSVSSDELGIFLRNILRENGYDPQDVSNIGFCTVVPETIYSMRNCCKRYFNITPFMIGPGMKSGLNIRYHNPLEVGADRIANSIAAIEQFPNQNIIIVDFGTATTFCAISSDRDYLGGTIVAGLKISMEALEKRTAKLPTVEIVKAPHVCGRSTVESIQAGLFYGNLGMVKEVTSRITSECFAHNRPLIIGTGGLARLYDDSKLFDIYIPDLVLNGIHQSLKMNRG
ncbi:MAG: type III pantothenate kinase [Bacteriovoracaceae bacterium]|nr:type III pantothenate kinase [Bacteriovoracaceae bacterium]